MNNDICLTFCTWHFERWEAAKKGRSLLTEQENFAWQRIVVEMKGKMRNERQGGARPWTSFKVKAKC